MVRDRVLDDLQQLLGTRRGANAQGVQQLHHQAGKTLESARNPDGRIDFDEDALGGMDVNLQFTRLVDRRVEQGQQALVRYIWASIANVAVHLAHYTDVLIAVEKRVLCSIFAILGIGTAMCSAISLQTRI